MNFKDASNIKRYFAAITGNGTFAV